MSAGFQYGYPGSKGTSNGTGGACPDGPMAKRRRVDDGQTGLPAESGLRRRDEQQQQQNAVSQYPSGFGEACSTGAAYTASKQDASPMTGFPDVARFATPYFLQPTDPSIYTSPWPPVSTTTDEAPYESAWPQTGLSADTMSLFPSAANAGNVAAQPYPEVERDQYAYGNSQRSAHTSSTLQLDDASMHLKLQSLSILDNLATQLIQTIAKASFPVVQDMIQGNDTEEGQAYNTLKSLFDQTRKVYSRDSAFIDCIAIQMFQPDQQEVVRKANIATFISSILGTHDVSFFHLNEFFMETFVPQGHRLLKWQGAIYLELKTQTYISALMNSDGDPEAMLDELFPADVDAQILARHPDAASLSPSEQDFIDRCKARKKYLLAETSIERAIEELPKKYQWNDFVREFAACITKNVEGIMNVPTRTQTVADRRSTVGAQTMQDGLVGSQQAARSGASRQVPLDSTQTNSTEKKATTNSSTVRQPWTKPEEDALLSGLEKVNGPHWSQILALYGRGGSVSEVLKDRNQVQLKDKARNLKLWYLKMGRDVPTSLRGVTGELRKRGGARARAALGLLDDESADMSAMGAGQDVEGEMIDPTLEIMRGAKGVRKKTPEMRR